MYRLQQVREQEQSSRWDGKCGKCRAPCITSKASNSSVISLAHDRLPLVVKSGALVMGAQIAPACQAIRYVLEDVCYSLRLSPSLPLSSNITVKTL
ncbi:hypothetical protein HBH70_183740 [Parastagonospora nodorum]|nr:hypothetical protein HBH52_199290 [Parastagonospora nodorum]KAH5130817.1 hypothetical protein HBH70_183740 [Parastagonospora nodorum]KAH5719845.1 hypothetical protein HBI18_159010 [Parastagonospora nodorum]KAH6538875.1 hypothetical protein HBI07_117050 [Parastagonospora nodorum]